jgi:uncharacterized protein with GYD domain
MTMPTFLVRFSYAPHAVRAMVDHPQDRSASAQAIVEAVGAKMLGLWFAYGSFDGVLLMEGPENSTGAAVAMAVGATGTMSNIETTVLMNMDEAQAAMRAASGGAYQPPS